MKLNRHYFTRQEQRGLLLIVIIIFLIGILRFDLYRHSQQNIQYSYLPIIPIEEEQNIQKHKTSSNRYNRKESTANTKPKESNNNVYLNSSTPFDPNSVTEQQLMDMKFPEFGIKNLIKYRNKSGVIKSVSHFKQIWGFEKLDSVFLDSILLFPKPKASRPKIKAEYSNSFKLPKPTFEETAKEPFRVHINQADTNQLKKLNGIGSYRAKKMVEYRDLLGGFYSVDQLDSLYWLPDSIFINIKEQLIIDSSDIRPIPVNRIHLKELVKHPYINYTQARLISNYIIEHGPLEDKADFYRLRGLDSIYLKRLLPYLSLD